MEDTNNIGSTAARPWDVVLSEDVIATINDNLPGLCMGEETPDEFVKAVDAALEANNRTLLHGANIFCPISHTLGYW